MNEMNDNKNYIGAEWVRVDLHLHSPGVESFILPDGVNISSKEEKRKIAKKYVNKLKSADIKIGAITDYNGIREEWFNMIREEAEGEGIKLFPGVELSLREGKYGIHVLIIFDENVSIGDVNDYIKHLDKDKRKLIDDRKHIDIDPENKLDKIVEKLKRHYDPLIIFPHPNEGDSKGLLNSFSPKDAVEYLKAVKPDAVEFLTDLSIKRLKDAGIDENFISRLTILENSDPKSLDDIENKERNGKVRATYLKLSDFSLPAIKLALHDPSVRVRLYEKPKMNFDRITTINIRGTTFLENIEIAVNPELNILIGGRGVGKSAILESIRYCFDLPVYQDESARKKFVYDVVGSGGEIEVELERFFGGNKLKYLIKRTIGKETEILDIESEQKVSLDIPKLFEGKSPILIGQKELYYVANNRKFLLSLIDDLIGESVKEKQKELEDVIKRLRENGERILKLKEKLQKKDEYEQELKNIDDEIKIFEKLKVVDKLKKWTEVIDNEERLNRAEELLKDVAKQIKSVLNDSMDVLSGQIEYLKKGKDEGKRILEEAVEILLQFKDFIEDTLKNFEDKTQKTLEDFEKTKSKWINHKGEIEKEIDEIKKKLGEQKLKPERLEGLISKKTKLQSIVNDMKKIEAELRDKINERGRLKEELKKKRHELFKVRGEELKRINNVLEERARLRIEFEKETEIFGEELKELMAGSGIRANVFQDIIKKEDIAIDGILLSEYIEKGKDKLMEVLALTDAMAKRMIDYFSPDKIRFKLEEMYPEDRIIVELKVNDEFKPIEDLSVGQKATALLLLLFAYENRILIFDQPEEDLDNRFIYEDVVKILREFKGKRQIIIATHNANIPVIGDSELILVLEAQKDKCKIIDRGSVDKSSIKQHIKNIMEGGEEAFKLRIEKYGGI